MSSIYFLILNLRVIYPLFNVNKEKINKKNIFFPFLSPFLINEESETKVVGLDNKLGLN